LGRMRTRAFKPAINLARVAATAVVLRYPQGVSDTVVGMGELTVLHTGATGRYGALAERLLERGHRVRALTRDPGSERARRLEALGAELVAGDLGDPATIAAAVAGADAAFFGGTLHAAGPDGDVRHAANVAEAARRAGAHLVLATVADADPSSPVPILSVKGEVEDRVRSIGVAQTIIAPAYLMENAFNLWHAPRLREHRYPLALPFDRPLQQAALADVVSFAAEVIDRREELDGARIEVASDELSGEQAARALSRVTGSKFEFERLAPERLPPHLRALFAWLAEVGHSIDVDALRAEHPEIAWHDFERWAADQELGAATPVGHGVGHGP
jgi:uncharacterized protein YbjT (DUF2867 family)